MSVIQSRGHSEVYHVARRNSKTANNPFERRKEGRGWQTNKAKEQHPQERQVVRKLGIFIYVICYGVFKVASSLSS